MLGWNSAVYAARARAFGWHPIEIDGHDLDEITSAYAEAEQQAQPTLIVARTLKGKGFKEIENKEGWHGKALPADMAERAIAELGGEHHIVVEVHRPESDAPLPRPTSQPVKLPSYAIGSQVATRNAYGDALKALGDARDDVVAVDGEVSNSTFAETFSKAHKWSVRRWD
jgi:transketolase